MARVSSSPLERGEVFQKLGEDEDEGKFGS